ncbi:MAG: hypothetical protein HQM08_14620 [Candidatus Riflebacteria bacterium]|nr:hypothetical protein [Candidatus Riflebacteria bacterium]
MNQKKLLIPEPKARKKAERTRSPKYVKLSTDPSPSLISPSQRSEAVGLILIGISIFFLSLFHNLIPFKLAGLLNFLTINFGVGIYLVPAIIGLMGLQRFLERPFCHLAFRFLGALGTLVFGLGLLGLEGGKVGATTFNFFSSRFGILPSRLLFLFFTLASLIFALDILYKDLIIGIFFFIKYCVVFFKWLWNVFIVLIAYLIGAVKTTINALHICWTYFRRLLQENSDSPEFEIDASTGVKLLTFNDISTTPPFSQLATPDYQSIPNPTSWRDVSSSEEPAQKVKTIPPASSSKDSQNVPSIEQMVNFSPLNVHVGNLASEVMITNIPPILFQPGPAEKVEQKTHPTPSDSEPQKNEPTLNPRLPEKMPFTLIGKGEPQKPIDNVSKNFVESKKFSEIGNTPVPESQILPASPIDTHDEFEEDSPVTLEDNLIDKEIKEQLIQGSEPSTNTETSSEISLPPIDLLTVPPPREFEGPSDLSERSALLLKTLDEFGIKAQITAVVEGPAVSRFELKPAPGIKVARFTSLIDDIALALSAPAIRIEAPIPGKPALGIEIPNSKPKPVYFYDLIKNEKFHSTETILNLALGVTINGKPVFADLTDMPHLLIAGSTGSGKSVCINTIIASILFQARPDQVKMVMIDPKMVELSSYNGIPHLISPVVTDPKKASAALLWAVEEMERRYELLASCGMRKISTYNQELPRLQTEIDSSLSPMPYMVIVIDELADLMMTASAEVEGSICRLAQMARAVGIHLVIATQRPSVDVLTGTIKANLPSRIAFSVTSHIDSRTILDTKGAEKLLGKGDMLFVPKGRNKPLRLQGAFVSDQELLAIAEWVKDQRKPEYIDIAPNQSGEGEKSSLAEENDSSDDSKLISEITSWLQTQEKTSTSMLQRKFKIGYNRAARIMDLFEEKGLVGPSDGSNKRRVMGKRSDVEQ